MEIKLSQLAEWFDKKSLELLRAFRQEARTILHETQRQIATLRKAGQELAANTTAPEEEKRYAARLSERILSSLRQLELPEQLNYDYVTGIHQELLRTVGDVTQAGRVYVPRLGSSFKAQIVELDFTLRRLAGNIEKLNAVLVKHRAIAQQVDQTTRRIQRLAEDRASAKDLRSKLSDLAARISGLEQSIEEAKQNVKRLHEETWFKDYSKAQRMVEDTEAKFSRFVSHLSKALRKMQRMSHDGQIGLVETHRHLLDRLVDSPVEILAKSEMLSLGPIFDKLEELLNSGKLKIEARKEKRAIEAVQEFRNGLIDRLRDEHSKVVADFGALEKRLGELGLGQKLETLHRSSRKLESELVDLKLERESVERRIGELQSNVQDALRLLRSTFSKLFGGAHTISAN